MEIARDRPRIVLLDDPIISGGRISEVISSERYEVFCPAREDQLGCVGRMGDADLVIVALEADAPAPLERIRMVRKAVGSRYPPMLAVADVHALCIDIPVLRTWGIVGLVPLQASPEILRDRIDRLLLADERRSCERSPCFFPVEVESLGREFALNLSASGMKLTAKTDVELNSELLLRFRLPVIAPDLIESGARVVRQSRTLNSAGRRELGVFFYPLSEGARQLIAREVGRLLGGESGESCSPAHQKA